jgi:hypothetical protein
MKSAVPLDCVGTKFLPFWNAAAGIASIWVGGSERGRINQQQSAARRKGVCFVNSQSLVRVVRVIDKRNP